MIEGLDELNEKLTNVVEEFPEKRMKALRVAAETVRGKAVKLTPTDTGLLRSSWKVQKVRNQEAVEIFNNTAYARHVEYGHRVGKSNKTVKGFKMLHQSIQSSEKSFEADVASVLSELIND